jgi:hypothetical protein
MGRRSEQRITISIPVIVHGHDSHRNPFVVAAVTQDVSTSGACLNGLNGFVHPGNKIEIECQNEKAWFRVQWVGKEGTPDASRAGVRCLEPGKYIWNVRPKEWEPDTYDPSEAAATPAFSPPVAMGNPSGESAPWSGKNRRRFPRRTCRIEAQVTTSDESVRLPGTVTDISLGGCYVEMLAPLPRDTDIELSLNTGDATLCVSGSVRSSQTGMGMGVAFTGMSPVDFERLRDYAPPEDSPQQPAKTPTRPSAPPRPAPTPTQPEIQPVAAQRHSGGNLPTTAEALEAVVRVLFRRGILTRVELAEELDKMKTVRK